MALNPAALYLIDNSIALTPAEKASITECITDYTPPRSCDLFQLISYVAHRIINGLKHIICGNSDWDDARFTIVNAMAEHIGKEVKNRRTYWSAEEENGFSNLTQQILDKMRCSKIANELAEQFLNDCLEDNCAEEYQFDQDNLTSEESNLLNSHLINKKVNELETAFDEDFRALPTAGD